MDTKKIIKTLSEAVCIGPNSEALDVACEMIGDKAEITPLYKNCAAALIRGESDKTIAIEAHIDEIGFVVTSVDDRGFLNVATAGGFDLRCLPSHRICVHGKEDVDAVFSSIPPHLTKGEAEFSDISELSLDTGLGERAKELISVGDFATYKKECVSLCGDRVTGKALDDRAGIAVLVLLAEKFKDKKPPVNLLLLLCNEEEIGIRGSTTSAFSCDMDEVIAIDVSFGDGPSLSPEECGKLGGGPMIGFSPILSHKISSTLKAEAEKNSIPFQCEVMGGRTGTDADAMSISKGGIPTGLVSIPLRNMHTDAEVISASDLENVAELLYSYVCAGGAFCD